MWGDESGNGIALDVTMKEAYSSGVGTTGLTADPPALRSAQSVSTLRDFRAIPQTSKCNTYHA